MTGGRTDRLFEGDWTFDILGDDHEEVSVEIRYHVRRCNTGIKVLGGDESLGQEGDATRRVF